NHVKTSCDIGHSQSRPPDEITGRGRPMTVVVTPGELSQCLVALQSPGVRRTLIQQRIGKLFASPRASAFRGFHFGAMDDISESHPLRDDTGFRERHAKFGAGTHPAAL